MSLNLLRRIVIFGTLACAVVLAALTVNSLRAVTSGRTAEVTDQVVSGKRVWQRRNCQDCHTLLGIGGYLAPEMTKEADRRDAQFLAAWLENPQAFKPGTTMPDQHLDRDQIDGLVAFLQWTSKIDTNNWPPAPIGARVSAGQSLSAGAILMQQKGCLSCHMINGNGSTGPGPNLSRISSTPYDGLSNSPDFLYKWIENPRSIKPDTIMPTIPMTPEQRDTIVAYLGTLK